MTPNVRHTAMSADNVIIVGRRLLRTYITTEARTCRRVHDNIIVYSTWRIYALSERLLVHTDVLIVEHSLGLCV